LDTIDWLPILGIGATESNLKIFGKIHLSHGLLKGSQSGYANTDFNSNKKYPECQQDL